jgi:hypothetical protein
MPLTRTTTTLRSQSGEHQVDVCPAEAGFVLSIGTVSIWLSRAAVAEISILLERALALQSPSDGLPAARN